MDPADHYLRLVKLGEEAFVTSVAPAALVRVRGDLAAAGSSSDEISRDLALDGDTETHVGREVGGRPQRRLEIYPLVKKAGAPFPDMITVGRTPNNDVVLRDVTISRLHAFFRTRGGAWFVADGGSKNGTFVDGARLTPPRKERAIGAGQGVKIGDLQLAFYTAPELYKMLSLITT